MCCLLPEYVLSFARINVMYLPELGGQLPPPPDPPSRTPMHRTGANSGVMCQSAQPNIVCLNAVLAHSPDILRVKWISSIKTNLYSKQNRRTWTSIDGFKSMKVQVSSPISLRPNFKKKCQYNDDHIAQNAVYVLWNWYHRIWRGMAIIGIGIDLPQGFCTGVGIRIELP